MKVGFCYSTPSTNQAKLSPCRLLHVVSVISHDRVACIHSTHRCCPPIIIHPTPRTVLLWGKWCSNLVKDMLTRRDEGTGTRPDYLVNHVLTKNEGPHRKKIVQKSRNSFEQVWEHTDSLTQSPNRASPETNINTQRIFFVSCLVRSSWHPLAPIVTASCTVARGSPGTLVATRGCTKSCINRERMRIHM